MKFPLIFGSSEKTNYVISGNDIENIIDVVESKKVIGLCRYCGWEKLMEIQTVDSEEIVEKQIELKKTVVFKLYEKLKKTKKMSL